MAWIIEYINHVMESLRLKSPRNAFLSKSDFAIDYRDADASIIIEETRNFSHNFKNELLAANVCGGRMLQIIATKSVHRHATREIIVLSRDLAAMNEGVHGSHLPSSLPLYKLHDGVTWFNLNT